MKKKVVITGSWRSASNIVKVRLPLIMFSEDDTQIIYCPALDLSGYGKTEPEARESFEITFDQFLQYTINKKTLAGQSFCNLI